MSLEKLGTETVTVHFSNGEGADRVLLKDGFGFCIKHRGFLESVEEINGKWYHVASDYDVHKMRNLKEYQVEFINFSGENETGLVLASNKSDAKTKGKQKYNCDLITGVKLVK